MSRAPNPELIGLTSKQKRALAARNYRAKHLEKTRAYNNAYQQSLRHNKNHALDVKLRRIEEINQMIDKVRAAAEVKIQHYTQELMQLKEQLNG